MDLKKKQFSAWTDVKRMVVVEAYAAIYNVFFLIFPFINRVAGCRERTAWISVHDLYSDVFNEHLYISFFSTKRLLYRLYVSSKKLLNVWKLLLEIYFHL